MLGNDCEKEVTENQKAESKNIEEIGISEKEKIKEDPKLEYSFQPDAETKSKEQKQKTDVYIPIGSGYVKTKENTNHEFPMPETSGIMYEIAEELYKKEKTASDIEALCQPPFKKVFGAEQRNSLDRAAGEKTQQLLEAVSDTVRKEIENGFQLLHKEQARRQRPISTAGAFFLQFMLAIPVLNILGALLFSFGKNTNANIKAYAKAFVIWCTVLMAGALICFTVYTFGSEESRNEIQKFISLTILK